MKEIIRAEHITKRYGKGDAAVYAVNDLSVILYEGDFTVILGRSGSGKTTLMHMLAGLVKPTEGEVYVDSKALWQMTDHGQTVFRRKNMGFIFQFFNLIPSQNVIENIVLPLHLDGQKEDRAYIDELLQELSLAEKKYAWVHELSGGQQQRTAIARALASTPRVIFADEPTGNLDSRTAKEVMDLLRRTQQKYRQTLIMVTHDIRIAEKADRVLILEDGKIREDIA